MKGGVVLLLLVAAGVLPGLAHARPAPVTWCGTDETSADRVPELTVGKSIRFVYAVPADGTDRFLDTASGIATDAAAIDAWWQQQDPTRTPRFDRYPFPGCTSDWGKLDIGFVRLPRTSAEYRNAPATYDLLEADLVASFPDDQKTVLYYDGPMAEQNLCGESPIAQFWGGRYGISIVFLQTATNCFMLPVGSGSSAQVAAHELLHSLGAAPDGAPNRCSGSHVCDSGTDILGSIIGLASTLDVVTLDYGRDDYYGHSGNWWDVQDSLWLSHLPERTITISVAGQGEAVVHSGDEPVACDKGCTVTAEAGSDVTIAGAPGPGWEVGPWSSSCSGSADSCTVGGTNDATITLTFVRASVHAVVRIVGKGRVTSAPGSLSCTGLCRPTFTGTDTVNLSAKPAAGWTFVGWSGDCVRKSCSIGDGASVVAKFAKFAKKKR